MKDFAKKTTLFWAAALILASFAFFNSAKAEILGRKNNGGSWQSQEIAVLPATRYIFRDQYKSSHTNEIDITYNLSDGSKLSIRVEQFPESKQWSSAQINFATPPNAVSTTISHLIFSGEGHIVAKNFNLFLDTN